MSAPAAQRRSPIGLRREVTLLVPASLLVLLALVVFTLLSYRAAIDQGVEERRREALSAARAAAGELATGGPPAPRLSDLRRFSAVGGAYLATLNGNIQTASGEELPGGLLDPFGALPGGVGDGVVTGPDAATSGRVVAVVPASVGGQPHLLRVDLDAGALAAQRRGLRVLTLVVLVAGVGVVVLLILFLRQLLAPYDELVARARALSGDEAGGAAGDEDDVELLVRTFERGMAALAAGHGGKPQGTGGPGDTGELTGGDLADADLAALQRTLAASLESGLLLLDRQGGVVALNAAGAELLGVDEPPPGCAVEEALDRHPDMVALLSRAVERGQGVQRKELRLTVPEPAAGGEAEMLLGLSVHPLRRTAPGGDAGSGEVEEVRGYLVLFADLTEARRRGDEARLEESLVRLGELAAGVAHELRNSLATMRGYLSLMERSPEDSPAGYLAEVRHEADQLQRVLEDFLAFARPGSARLEEVSLVAIAERAAADPALQGGEVEVVAAPGTPTLTGDPQMLERAVRNLMSNAREAHREAGAAGPVAVRVGPVVGPAGGVELSVEDRGEGVPAELEGRLFDPFVTGRPGGVGLGLALSHRIVGLHGGTLRLEPREGGGTRARISFPAERLAGESPVEEDDEGWQDRYEG